MISGKVCLSSFDQSLDAELFLVADTQCAVCATTAELELSIPEVILRPSISTNLLTRKYVLSLSMRITRLFGSVTYHSRSEIPIAVLACHQQNSDERFGGDYHSNLHCRDIEQQFDGPPPAYVS